MDPEWLQNIPFKELFQLDAELQIGDETFVVTRNEMTSPGNYDIRLSQVGVVASPDGKGVVPYDDMADLLDAPAEGQVEEPDIPASFKTELPAGWPNI